MSDVLILQNQVLIMKCIKEISELPNSLKKELNDQIMFTKSRINNLL